MLSINKRTVNRSNIITVENKDVYLQETIGQGRYGRVCCAADHTKNENGTEEEKKWPDFKYACKIFKTKNFTNEQLEEIQREIVISRNTAMIVNAVFEKEKIYLF